MHARTKAAVLASSGLAAASLFVAAPVFADNAAAQALFDEARKAMAEGNYAAACPKFADSEKLDPGAGTLLNLANCYEKNGQSASAWATFKDAAAEARKSGHPDWEGTARKRAAALEGTLSHLTVDVPPANVVDGLALQRDGVPMARAEWGVAIPVDPGSHVIDATAPNAHKWSWTVPVGAGGATASVTVPALEIEKTPVLPPPPLRTGAKEGSSGTQKVAGEVFVGVGVAGIVVGTLFGVEAIAKNNQALAGGCSSSGNCDQNGYNLTSDAKTFATLSTIGFVAGGALAALGAVLFFTAPSRHKTESALRLGPIVGGGAVGMSLGGAW